MSTLERDEQEIAERQLERDQLVHDALTKYQEFQRAKRAFVAAGKLAIQPEQSVERMQDAMILHQEWQRAKKLFEAAAARLVPHRDELLAVAA